LPLPPAAATSRRTKVLVRQTLRRLGYDLHRFLPVSSPDAQLAQVLRRFGIGLVIDIGANTGQHSTGLRQIGYSGRIVSFEPLADAWATLNIVAAGDPGWTVAPRGAIGEREGEIVINIAGNSASSSVLDMLDSHRGAASDSAYVGKESVPSSQLYTVAVTLLAGTPRLYVKIETQGYEAQVLAGGTATIAAAAAVQVELSLTPLYAGQPDLAGGERPGAPGALAGICRPKDRPSPPDRRDIRSP